MIAAVRIISDTGRQLPGVAHAISPHSATSRVAACGAWLKFEMEWRQLPGSPVTCRKCLKAIKIGRVSL